MAAGTVLKNILLEIGVSQEGIRGCNCAQLEELMNIWGERCLNPGNLQILIDNMKENYEHVELGMLNKLSIGIRLVAHGINPVDPYEALIRLAVQSSLIPEKTP